MHAHMYSQGTQAFGLYIYVCELGLVCVFVQVVCVLGLLCVCVFAGVVYVHALGVVMCVHAFELGLGCECA